MEDDRPDPYERDAARIIHSAPFRRLQAKTQVLGIGEGDFHRTRLTHSMEVAQIGRGIVRHLRRDPYLSKGLGNSLPSDSLIEAVCLGHDLGHPPFGHGGEVALDYCMRDYGGFEGNGQTLRIVSLLASHTPGYGLDLTRRTMLGLLKYPIVYTDALRGRDHREVAVRAPLDWHPPKSYHAEEKGIVEWILKTFPIEDQKRFVSLMESASEAGDIKHAKSLYKSLDCSIMELADDIAYGVHDLEDGIALGLIREEDWVRHNTDQAIEPLLGDGVREKLFLLSKSVRKAQIGDIVHCLMTHLSEDEDEEFQHPVLRFNIKLSSKGQLALKALKRLTYECMIRRPEARTLEWRGQELVRQMFEVLLTHGDDLLPLGLGRENLAKLSPNDLNGRARIMCDFIAGMTDEYATRMFERLFVPRQRSAFEHM